MKSFRDHPCASVYFVDQAHYAGVSLPGTVEVLETAEAKEMLWESDDELLYPEGVTDPDDCVRSSLQSKAGMTANWIRMIT